MGRRQGSHVDNIDYVNIYQERESGVLIVAHDMPGLIHVYILYSSIFAMGNASWQFLILPKSFYFF